ncbi:MAG: hypothetical protein ACI8PZ_006040 [Myxococcota bacterium]|jgi:hypothetical protein
MRVVVAGLAAVLAPLVVLVGGGFLVQDFADSKEADARKNAGYVLNGDRLSAPVARVIDSRLADRTDTVLVLGNSMANNAIEPRRLGDQLKIRKRLEMLTVPGSIGAHWYAMLAHRVYAQGHRPTLVLIVSSLQTLVETAPTSTAARINLAALAGDVDDPVLRKAYPGRWSFHGLHRQRANRDKVRSFAIETVRGLGVGTLFHDAADPRGRLAQGMRRAELSNQRTFATAKLDFSVHDPTMFRQSGTNLTAQRLPHPDESFLPDIVRLAEQHGTKLVFVRTPLSPLVGPGVADVLPDGYEERVIELLESVGGKYLDFGDMELGAGAYKDPIHMRSGGAQRFTRVVASRLRAVQAHVPDVGWWRPRFPAADVAPGEATHPIATGDSRTFTFDTPWPGPGKRVKVEAVLLPTEPHRSTLPPTLSVGDVAVPMEWSEDAWRLDAWVPRLVELPWVLTVHAGGEAVAPAAIVLGDFDHAAYVVGDDAALKGPEITLVGDRVMPFEAAAPPIAVPGGTDALISGPRASGVLPFPGFAKIYDALVDGGDTPSICAPVRIIENGRPLESRGVTCARLAHSTGGRSCFDGERVAFTTTDRRPPTNNGRHYSVELHPDRACDGRVWLYPGDRLTFEVDAATLAPLPYGAGRLAMSALFSDASPSVRARVLARGHPILELTHEHTGPEARSGFVRKLQLPAPAGEKLVVELENLSDSGFALVTHLALRR